MRRLTTYRQPPIAERLGTAPDPVELANGMRALARATALGQVDPDPRTQRRWVAAFWMRAEEFVRDAATPEDACFAFNCVRPFFRVEPRMEEPMRRLLAETCRRLPSEAERLLAQGIVIEGITNRRTTA